MSRSGNNIYVPNVPMKRGCSHKIYRSTHTQESTGSVERRYCVSCNEFIELVYHESKKLKNIKPGVQAVEVPDVPAA
jgi:hypothetical protein